MSSFEGIIHLIGIALALIIGILADKFSNKNQKFPRIILLLLGGFLLNELSVIQIGRKIIIEEDLEYVALIVELTLSLVLFKEGLELNLQALKKYLKPVLLLASIGLAISTFISAFILYLITPMTIYFAILVSGLLAPTDPAATFSLFKGGLRIKPKEMSIIGGESAFNDAIAIVLVTTVFIESVVHNTLVLNIYVIIEILSSFFGGILLGYMLGRFFLRINNKLDHYTQTNYISISLVILTFTLSQYLHIYGINISAAITSLTAGAVFGNPQFFRIERFSQHHLHEFQSNISELAELLSFVTIGMLISPIHLGESLGIGLTIAVIAIISRTITIIILSKPSKIDFKESIFISMGGMRGLATGVLAAIVLPPLIGLDTPFPREIFLNSILFALLFTSLIQGLSIKKIGYKTDSLIHADKRQELRLERRIITSEISFYRRKLDKKEMSKAEYSALAIPLYDKLGAIKIAIEAERKSRVQRFKNLLNDFEKILVILDDLTNYNIDKIKHDQDNSLLNEKISYYEKEEDKLSDQIINEIEKLRSKFDYITETEDKETGQVTQLIQTMQEKIAELNEKYNSVACDRICEKINDIEVDN
ncbi:MAG: cation:proton antiporter [Candidatus Heimdallarchaeota archaeon]|nr:cation:proton antiporter [Candidatus Heimdallarchaeota archaeon]